MSILVLFDNIHIPLYDLYHNGIITLCACAHRVKQSFCMSVGMKITTNGNLGILATP